MAVRILVVDDDARLLGGVARHLRRCYEVELAEDPRKALELVSSGGPFAVVMSDYQMPGMNGIDFLTRVRELAPESSRILLTGNSGLDIAIRAVNQGEIFRFLAKPCDLAVMEMAINSGARQFQLLQSERVLLEQTLTGSIEAMIRLLENLDTAAFRKAQQITILVRRAACELNLIDLWPLTVAAPMTQLALLSLPTNLLDRQRRGLRFLPEETRMVAQAYEAMAEVLENVPRLEPVCEILRRVAPSMEPPDGTSKDFQPITIQVLRATMALVDAMDRVPVGLQALDSIQGELKEFHPSVGEALGVVLSRDLAFSEAHRQVRAVNVAGLRSGHLLLDSIRTLSGRVLLPAGLILDQTRIEMIRELGILVDDSHPIQVMEPLPT
ncbi:MAG: response regulator [Acidobacteria bacterium]|nr:response regulator [Acidobacteriota bacterium]